jgi:3-oxoacyl-(acyl-carrier-protein) synthase
MKMKKIVITDFDVTSSAGFGRDEFSKNLLANEDYSSEIRTFDAKELKCNKAYVINDINFDEILGKTGLKHINRNAKLAFTAIEKNLAAGFKNLPENEKPGLILGTAFGSVDSVCSFWETYLLEGNNSLRPLEFPNTVINSVSSFINIRYGLGDISATVSTGYNSSHDALIYAYDYINNGYGEYLIVGGCEELGKYFGIGQQTSGVLSGSGTMMPFGKNRDGYLPGEGGAFFIVESYEHATKRDAKIIAELSGFSSIFSNERKNGMIDVYRNAIDMAGIMPSEIDLISSSANGSRNDAAILDTYKCIFGDDIGKIAVTAHKKYFGECYGAGGALQLAACLSNSMKGAISPLYSNDLVENLKCFSDTSVERKINHFAIDGFSCEGNNAVLIFKSHI